MVGLCPQAVERKLSKDLCKGVTLDFTLKGSFRLPREKIKNPLEQAGVDMGAAIAAMQGRQDGGLGPGRGIDNEG